MLEKLYYNHNLHYNKQDMIMIGDASGKPGDFSDSDKNVLRIWYRLYWC